MSEKTTTENKSVAPAASAKASADIFEAIGPTLTIQKAKAIFGDNAVAAMQTVAAIGGHGMFEPHELAHPLFGGLQLPNPDKVIVPKRNDFAAGEVGDHMFELAQEDYKRIREVTADNRAKTKEALTALR